jgi:hypothetical protein
VRYRIEVFSPAEHRRYRRDADLRKAEQRHDDDGIGHKPGHPDPDRGHKQRYGNVTFSLHCSVGVLTEQHHVQLHGRAAPARRVRCNRHRCRREPAY